MNLLTKLTKIAASFSKELEAVKLEQQKLADGTVIEADSFEVGQAAFLPTEDGEAIPLPAGAYELDGGITIEVDDMGVIIDVVETAAKEEAPEEAEEEATPEMAKPELTPTAKKIIESNVKETVFSQVELKAAVDLAKVEASKEVTTLNETIASLKLERDTLQERLDNEPAAAKLNRSPEGRGKEKTGSGQAPERKSTANSRILERIQNLN